MGAPATLVLIVNEAMNGANLGLSMFFGLTTGAADLIETYGSDSLKQKYVAKMYQGKFTGTMCLSEPQAGSDGISRRRSLQDQRLQVLDFFR